MFLTLVFTLRVLVETCFLLVFLLQVVRLLLELFGVSFQVAAAALMALYPFLCLASLFVAAVRALKIGHYITKVWKPIIRTHQTIWNPASVCVICFSVSPLSISG